MKQLIRLLKTKKQRAYIHSNGKKKYAFIGVGTHSIYNLYPVINHFRLDLKYIVTKSNNNANLIDENFPNSTGTSNLDLVLSDKEISGVFVSAHPTAHYSLVKKILEAGKNVFVEKPPCYNSEELKDLIETENKSTGTCIVGLQKQYAPSNLKLKESINFDCTYNYRYVTGGYPEGDPILDLFIHPIALITYFFGEVIHQNIVTQETKAGKTIFLQLTHKNNNIGSIELSTNYSWRNPTEKLIVNSKKGIYEINNTEELSLEPKSLTIMGIPTEKVFNQERNKIYLKERSNFIPMLTHNQLYTSGYFSEIKTFIDLCEGKAFKNNSSLSSCIEAYNIIKKIKNV